MVLFSIQKHLYDTTANPKSCAQSLDFHPILRGVLVVGTFNGKNKLILSIGDITIFSIYHETKFICSSSSGQRSHSEPIATVVWKKSLINATFELVSVANDGKILVWNDGLNDAIRGYS